MPTSRASSRRGEYGAGAVEVWDRGTFVNLKPAGEGEFAGRQRGARPRGGAARGREAQGGLRADPHQGGQGRGLAAGEDAGPRGRPGGDPLQDRPRSVLTGRTLEEIAAGKGYLPEQPGKLRVSISGRTLTLTNLDKVLVPRGPLQQGRRIELLHRHLSLHPAPRGEAAAHHEAVSERGGGGFLLREELSRPQARLARRHRGGQHQEGGLLHHRGPGRPGLGRQPGLAGAARHAQPFTRTYPGRPCWSSTSIPGRGWISWIAPRRASKLRAILAGLGLKCFPKTSGGKGLHVLVPLNTPVSFQETKDFAHAVALMMQELYPGAIVSNMRKALRKGRIFVDWSQNDEHKTTVCAYSLRAQPRPTVSAPVTWEELETAIAGKDRALLYFEAADVLKRVMKEGDLFKPVVAHGAGAARNRRASGRKRVRKVWMICQGLCGTGT